MLRVAAADTEHPGSASHDEQLLVHGAAGGVGTALLQLGSLAGLEMYGTTSAATLDLVAELGATPIDYRSDDSSGSVPSAATASTS